jgi:hypothetical protein
MFRSTRFPWLTTGALALLVATAACGRDVTSTGPAGSSASNRARLTVRLASVSTSSSTSSGAPATLGGILASDFGGPGGFDGPGGFGDFSDGIGHHWRGWWGWMRARDVDSLVVTATKLEVLAALPDSEDAADSLADSVSADSGWRHGDNDADDWEQREFGWTELPVVGDSELDLIHLPDSAAAGLPIATGTLPPGRYRHVRLFITNPMIYFDSLIVTPAGDTLQAGVGYPVTFPAADSTGAVLKTDDPFVVPAAGDTVALYFDRDDTVRHIIITSDGQIIVPPVMRFRHFGH